MPEALHSPSLHILLLLLLPTSQDIHTDDNFGENVFCSPISPSSSTDPTLRNAGSLGKGAPPRASGLSQETPGHVWRHFWLLRLGGGALLLVSSGWSDSTLPSAPPCPGQPPTAEGSPARDASSAEIEKPCSAVIGLLTDS